MALNGYMTVRIISKWNRKDVRPNKSQHDAEEQKPSKKQSIHQR